VVKAAGSVEFVKISEIDWIEAADYYSRIHAGALTRLLRRTIADLAEELDDSVFCRIHRSTIVRLERIRIHDSVHLSLQLDGRERDAAFDVVPPPSRPRSRSLPRPLLTFDQVYARTNVPVTLHQVDGADEEGTEIVLD
jgi:hypothetical protein